MTDPLEIEERNGLTGARLWGYQTYLSLAATGVVFAILASHVDLAQVLMNLQAQETTYQAALAAAAKAIQPSLAAFLQ